MASHEPGFIVVGDEVVLGPLRRDLAADYARWMHEPTVRCGLNQLGIATPPSQEKWVEDNLEADRAPSDARISLRGIVDLTAQHGLPEFGAQL
jgi:hypothetical protein